MGESVHSVPMYQARCLSKTEMHMDYSIFPLGHESGGYQVSIFSIKLHSVFHKLWQQRSQLVAKTSYLFLQTVSEYPVFLDSLGFNTGGKVGKEAGKVQTLTEDAFWYRKMLSE